MVDKNQNITHNVARSDEIEDWMSLSDSTQIARHKNRPLETNEPLLKAADKFDTRAIGSVYRLWIADNHLYAGDWEKVPKSYDSALQGNLDVPFAGIDVHGGILERRAAALERGPFSFERAEEARHAHIAHLNQQGESSSDATYRLAHHFEINNKLDSAL